MKIVFIKSVVQQKGQILVFALVLMSIIVLMMGSLFAYTSSQIASHRSSLDKERALHIAEGGMEMAIWKLNNQGGYTGESDTPFGAGTFTISVMNINSSEKSITVTGYIPNSTNPIASRTVKITATIGTDTISFRYGVQAGNGGFSMSQSSSIIGNAYTTGPIVMANSSTITGDAISAGFGGSISGTGNTIGGSAYGHTLSDIRVTNDAYYYSSSTMSGVIASGSACPNSHCHPNSQDQGLVALPISDEQITDWENDAAAGGTISSCDENGNYTIDSTMTLGAKKITCNLVVSGNGILTITGPIWVVGNISTINNVTIKIASSLGSQNVAIIADDPANRSTKGIIDLNNSGQFQGSGSAGSYVFLISQNNSAENGGTTNAITMSSSSNALVLYASHGKVTVSNNVSLKEVTAYNVVIQNSSSITYDSGLPSTIFQSGPGGSWEFEPGSYSITK